MRADEDSAGRGPTGLPRDRDGGVPCARTRNGARPRARRGVRRDTPFRCPAGACTIAARIPPSRPWRGWARRRTGDVVRDGAGGDAARGRVVHMATAERGLARVATGADWLSAQELRTLEAVCEALLP